jgi:hypothetical protein
MQAPKARQKHDSERRKGHSKAFVLYDVASSVCSGQILGYV